MHQSIHGPTSFPFFLSPPITSGIHPLTDIAFHPHIPAPTHTLSHIHTAIRSRCSCISSFCLPVTCRLSRRRPQHKTQAGSCALITSGCRDIDVTNRHVRIAAHNSNISIFGISQLKEWLLYQKLHVTKQIYSTKKVSHLGTKCPMFPIIRCWHESGTVWDP
jgi:hypothetical protein